MNNYRFAIVVVSLLILPILSYTVIAEDNEYPYDEDGWLTRIAGPERFSLGDEFGCQGCLTLTRSQIQIQLPLAAPI